MHIVELGALSAFSWYQLCGSRSMFHYPQLLKVKLHGCIWILAHISSNPTVSRTYHKCVRNASILCAMVVKIACTMRPTKLLNIMQFGLLLQYCHLVVTYLITFYMRHPSYLRNLLPACILVTHHGNSLLMQLQACRICCFCAIALRSSNPHTH